MANKEFNHRNHKQNNLGDRRTSSGRITEIFRRLPEIARGLKGLPGSDNTAENTSGKYDRIPLWKSTHHSDATPRPSEPPSGSMTAGEYVELVDRVAKIQKQMEQLGIPVPGTDKLREAVDEVRFTWWEKELELQQGDNGHISDRERDKPDDPGDSTKKSI